MKNKGGRLKIQTALRVLTFTGVSFRFDGHTVFTLPKPHFQTAYPVAK